MDISSPKIKETFDLTLDRFSYKGVPNLLCLCLAIILYYVGFVNILWTAVRSLIIQTIMLLIMFLMISLTWKYVSVRFLDFVDSRDGNCTMVELLGKIAIGEELCSDFLILICFITIINGYLYKRLPYSFIPNWIPLIGLADEVLVNAFQVMAGVGICALVLFQMKHTSSTYTQRFSHIEKTWKQCSKFVVETSLAEKVQVCFRAFFYIHRLLVAILGWSKETLLKQPH